MRVSDYMHRQSIGEQLSRSSERISQLQTQISSGVRFQRASEDPESAVRVATINTGLAQVAQYQRNVTTGEAWLKTEDATLGNIRDLVRQARTLALQGVNETATNQRPALAAQIDALRTSIMAAGNTKVGDRYLFAGYKTATVPLTDSATGVQDHGDTGVMTLAIGEQTSIALNTTGEQVFNLRSAANAGTPDVFTSLANLSAALNAGDQAGIQTGINELDTHGNRLDSLRGNSGIRLQQVQFAGDQLVKSHETLTGLISNVQGTDITQALVSLQQEQNILQAASYVATNLTKGGLLYWLK